MRSQIILASAILVLALFSCQTKVKEDQIIGKKDLKLSTDRMTPEVLWSLGRVGEFEVSPDHKQVLFSITYFDIPKNKSNRDLYVMAIDGSDLRQLTKTPENEFNYLWRPDGKKIGYLSTVGGSAQIWEMNPDGSGKTQVSNFEGGLNGFMYSPDQKKIAFSAEVSLENMDLKKLYEGLPLAQGKVIDKMMFRHWDEWRGTYSHLFIADLTGRQMTNPVDILKDEPYDFPNKPFSGMEQLSWHPDCKSLAYSCVKKEGRAYATSTNSDIYIYDLETKQTVNLTDGMMGYDLAPLYSPDGKYITWTSMERNGYEADKLRIMVYDIKSKSKVDYTGYFDKDA